MDTRFIQRAGAVGFSIIIVTLFYLQILKGDYYRDRARNNYIKIVPIPSIRGTIFDRRGIPLAIDKPVFNIAVTPYEIKRDKQTLFNEIAKFVKVEKDVLYDNYKKNFHNLFSPVNILTALSKEEALRVKERFQDRVLVKVEPQRYYPFPYEFSHILGYVKEANALPEKIKYGYAPSQRMGVRGIEQYYDSYLKGENGGDLLEVNSRGNIVGFVGKKDMRRGKDIYLTIDSRIQKLAYQSLGDHRGSIVIMNPYTGEIIALVSKPSFNLNNFITGKRIEKILKDPGRSLINRAIQGVYPPGSVFKPILAVGGLEKGVINPSTTFNCEGKIIVGDTEFKCWAVHGRQDLVSALAHSCNVYFYNLGLKLGVDNIAKWAKIFGLNQLTGIDLPYEKSGLVPGKVWKKKYRKSNWFVGDTLNLSIGQGYVGITPLRAVTLISVFANRGYLVHPFLAKRVDKLTLPHFGKKHLPISKKNIEVVRKGLREVVASPTGTGHLLEALNLDIAGKTGTAQTQGENHGWFVGFFPYHNPRYAFCVFLEHGGSSYQAIKVAYQLLKKMQEDNLL